MNYFRCIGGVFSTITKTIIANGIYDASEDGADGYSQVSVNVPQGGLITNELIIKSQTYTTQ